MPRVPRLLSLLPTVSPITCILLSRLSRHLLTVVGVGVTYVPQLRAFNMATPMSSAMALCGIRCGGISPWHGKGSRRQRK